MAGRAYRGWEPNEDGGGSWWAVDHLLLDQDGTPTFIEVKRSTDTRVHREVVAQMIEYAANATAYWRAETLRTWFEDGDADAAAGRHREFLRDPTADPDEFWARVAEKLEAARVRCIFVADSVPPTLRRLVEFLNEHLDTVEVFAVEIPQYASEDSGLRALVPRLVGQTAKAQARKQLQGPSSRRRWDGEAFMAELGRRAGQSVAKTAKEILDWLPAHGFRVGWGSGRESGSLIAVVDHTGAAQVPFSLWTYGKIELDFQYLSYREPYRSEGVREQLRGDLNRALGTTIPPDAITLRPTLPMSLLESGEVLERFLRVMDGLQQNIRSHVPAEHPAEP